MGKIAEAYRKEAGYTGHIGRSMPPEQWNDYCKFASRWRKSRPEHKKVIAERKADRKERTAERAKLARLNVYYNCKPGELVFLRIS